MMCLRCVAQDLDPIPDDKMEVGLGIHGEPGIQRVRATTTAEEIVEIVASRLEATVVKDVPLCVLINNLGAVPQIEMAILARQVMESEALGSRIELVIGPACVMTSLDMNGFSISVAPLDDPFPAGADPWRSAFWAVVSFRPPR